MKKTIRLILGDQLNQQHSWFSEVNEKVTYAVMEVRSETDYVQHHIQKVLSFFLAMRAFADDLKAQGHQVVYYNLDDQSNQQSFSLNIKTIIKSGGFERFEYQLPDEFRLDEELNELSTSLDIETDVVESEHFYTGRLEMKELFDKKKSKGWLMESFYREMRKKHDLLIDLNDKPIGGKWNFDQSNRKKLPKNHKPIAPKLFQRDVSELVQLLEKHGVKTIGSVDTKNFVWPVTRKEAEEMLDFFVAECLPLFGDFQDAMTVGEWSLYHSRLSFLMNSKILSPKEVIDRVVEHWEENQETIDISQVEGFVRQIIGWREYMRGIYWAKMPNYEQENQLNHTNKLPEFYWTGKTKMNCMKQSIQQSLQYSYAHHIQRLMVTGNFALLAGVDPNDVDEWYLGIYIDAIQWVELPNTRGMSQWADGGLVATKPYVSSANYIDKMSDYCSSCYYSKKEKVGEKACPFNSLYWNFIDQHIEKWEKNHRMGMMVANWKKQDPEQKVKILERAQYVLDNISTI
ncbi:MAG: deoxyribodipyrimidine photolyase-related protein [Vicingaceae bacterium]|jgi:deoxyribodipyrimidine photolyase-related protein